MARQRACDAIASNRLLYVQEYHPAHPSRQ